MKRLDLTGDRPLTRTEARKLTAWWRGVWSVTVTKVRRNRYSVEASKS